MTVDPIILGRLELAVAILAGLIIVGAAWQLFVWFDDRRQRRYENAVNARLARRYRNQP